jgi:hypothetical protein
VPEKKINWGFAWLLGAAVLVLFADLSALSNWIPGIPGLTTKVAQATWIYEQRAGDPPGYVEAAISELNLRIPPVIAEQLDVDIPPPPRLVAPFAAAKAKGLPAFVTSEADGKVIKTLAGGDLKTKADVLGAVR